MPIKPPRWKYDKVWKRPQIFRK